MKRYQIMLTFVDLLLTSLSRAVSPVWIDFPYRNQRVQRMFSKALGVGESSHKLSRFSKCSYQRFLLPLPEFPTRKSTERSGHPLLNKAQL